MKTIKNGNLMVVLSDSGEISSYIDKTTGIYLLDNRMVSVLTMLSDIGLEKLETRIKQDRLTNFYLGKIESSGASFDLEIRENLKVRGNELEITINCKNYSNISISLDIGYKIIYNYEDIFSVRAKNSSYDLQSNEDENAKQENDQTKKTFFSENKVYGDLPGGNIKIAPGEEKSLTGNLHFKRELNIPHPLKEIVEDRPIKKLNPWCFDPMLNVAINDINKLLIPTVFGDFPGAGLPWYGTVFGRDSLIFALQTLERFPDTARTILRVLSLLQGKKIDRNSEESPGKIIHEARLNDLSLSGKVPFSTFYGTVDATLLYLILAGEYLRVTGDMETIEELLPNIENAAIWIDTYGDIDGDGYVEFIPSDPELFPNQGWKDSQDSMSFKDGNIPGFPLALVEVQGYLYSAYIGLDYIYKTLGLPEQQFDKRAQELKKKFNKDFWLGDYFALALDKNKNKVDSISSNPGHCLYSRIIDDEKAPLVIQKLLEPDMFSGWGIRTLSSDMAKYNPFSYHNGSIWPHDNALIIEGMYRYGYNIEAQKTSEALLEALSKFDSFPELFSGIGRQKFSERPVSFPVSCQPQLWSAGAVIQLKDILNKIRRYEEE